MQVQALSNAKTYDWATWLIGIWRSIIQGASGSVVSSLTAMGIDSEHFNLGNGLHDVFKMIGTVFVVTGMFYMFVFLQTHGAPEVVAVDVQLPQEKQP
jgi:hypothetical protein